MNAVSGVPGLVVWDKNCKASSEPDTTRCFYESALCSLFNAPVRGVNPTLCCVSCAKDGDDVPHILFRVVNWHPSRFKAVRSRGEARRLNSTSLAVTFHRATFDSGTLLAELRPVASHVGVSSPIYIIEHLLPYLHQADSLPHLECWKGREDEKEPDGFFAFSLGDVGQNHEVVQELLEHHAFDSDSSITLMAPEAHKRVVLQAGLIEEVEGTGLEAGLRKHFMTQRGLQHLVACQRLSVAARADSVRPSISEDLGKATTYELTALLSLKGFLWQRMPPKRRRPEGPTGVFSIDLHFPEAQARRVCSSWDGRLVSSRGMKRYVCKIFVSNPHTIPNPRTCRNSLFSGCGKIIATSILFLAKQQPLPGAGVVRNTSPQLSTMSAAARACPGTVWHSAPPAC